MFRLVTNNTKMLKPINRVFSKSYGQSGSRNVLPFVDDAKDYDLKAHYQTFSLDEFYSDLIQFELSDEDALNYMKFAAKLACINFGTQEEMLRFKGDFQASLAFI